MTISSEDRRAGPYDGNNTATSFAFDFKVFAKENIQVIRTDSDGMEQVLVLDSDYSVTLNGDQDADPGGSITYPISGAPLPVGESLTVLGALEYTQTADITNQGGFYPQVVENALDRNTILIQQLKEIVDRALTLPASAPTSTSTQLPQPESNALIGWNQGANALQNVDPSTLATIVAYGTANADVFTGDGTTAQFSLSSNPGALANLDVAIGGVTQLPNVDYTWAGGTVLNTTSPVPNGEKLLVRYMQGLPFGVTDAANVQFSPAGTGAVSTSVEQKLRDYVSITDFGASPNASAANNTIYITNALTHAGTKRSGLYVPAAASPYLVNNEFTVPQGVVVFGEGYGSLIQQTVQNKGVFILSDDSAVRDTRLKVIDGDGTAFVNCIYANGKKNVRAERNYLESADYGGCGVQFRNCYNTLIRSNIIYNGKWTSGGAGVDATAADILFYSTTGSGRHIIEGNFSLSNNSQGIWIDALGYDADILVKGNVCVTLDPATCIEGGAWSEVATGGVRRHGISVAYNSSLVGGPRVVVVNNICRNTRWTGIYKQGTSSGPVIIANNICTNNGYQQSNTLSGGVYATISGYEAIVGNYIGGFQQAVADISGGITLGAASAPTSRTLIANNVIRGSASHGLYFNTQASLCDVRGNTFDSNAAADIRSIPSNAAGVGGHRIEDNSIRRTSGTAVPGISMSKSALNDLPVMIRGNYIRGNDNTTVNNQNTGIRTTGDVSGYFMIQDNTIERFYYAHHNASYQTGRRIDMLIERNLVRDCNTGFDINATSNNVTVPLIDNRFIGVTNRVSGSLGFVAGRICQRWGERLQWESTAAPAVGSWSVGDRSVNTTPAVGSPKAWSCTVAGTPGTWVSEGNL